MVNPPANHRLRTLVDGMDKAVRAAYGDLNGHGVSMDAAIATTQAAAWVVATCLRDVAAPAERSRAATVLALAFRNAVGRAFADSSPSRTDV